MSIFAPAKNTRRQTMKKFLLPLLAVTLALAGSFGCEKAPQSPIPSNPGEQTGGQTGGQPGGDDPSGPGQTTGPVEMEYEYTDIDVENYIYPEKGATINPNLVKFDSEKGDVVTSLDTLNKKAVLTFGSEVPKLYRGVIIPVVWNEGAYPLFILSAEVSGKTATIEYRDAAITEMFFNRTISISNQITKSTDKDYDGKFMSALKLLQLVDTGFQMYLDKVDIDFGESTFDMTFGEFTFFSGKSVNCPFKRVKALLVGKVNAEGHFSVTPSFNATKGWSKDLKQGVARITKLVPIEGFPVLIDFNIDICGDLNLTSSIGEMFNYYQILEGGLELSLGGEYNFETGVLTPMNKLEFHSKKHEPIVSSLSNKAAISLDAAVFPRFKIYFYKFKYAGFGADLKPIFAKLEYSATKKEGHIFDDFTFSLGSSLKAFMYAWDFQKECNKNLAESPTAENMWFNWHSPAEVKDNTAGQVDRFNYGGKSQCTFSVEDLAYEWDQQTVTPPAAKEMSIEVEAFSTLPDPNINPECYDDFNGGKPMATKAIGGGWYSQGKEYYYLKENGEVDVPFTVKAPAGEKFKVVARILDGKGNPIKEVEHPCRNGIKSYTVNQTMTAEGMSGKAVVTVDDWGAVVHEEITLPGMYNNVTFRNGTYSGYMVVEGQRIESNSFFGPGEYHAKLVPYGLGSSNLYTMGEALDHARWANEVLGLSTDGSRYYDTVYSTYSATRCVLPDGGTFTYVGNAVVEINAEGIRLTTEKLTINEDAQN